MKKFIFLLILSLIPVFTYSKSPEWVEMQSVVVPSGTPLYHYYSKDGNIKYALVLGDIYVSVSTKNAEGYLSGIYKLEVVKWYSHITGKYKYTTRQYKPNQTADIDLQTVFGSKVKPTTYFNPQLNEK
jgi:hypothetical protein